MKELEELEQKLLKGDIDTLNIPKEQIVSKSGEKTVSNSNEKVAILN